MKSTYQNFVRLKYFIKKKLMFVVTQNRFASWAIWVELFVRKS